MLLLLNVVSHNACWFLAHFTGEISVSCCYLMFQMFPVMCFFLTFQKLPKPFHRVQFIENREWQKSQVWFNSCPHRRAKGRAGCIHGNLDDPVRVGTAGFLAGWVTGRQLAIQLSPGIWLQRGLSLTERLVFTVPHFVKQMNFHCGYKRRYVPENVEQKRARKRNHTSFLFYICI